MKQLQRSFAAVVLKVHLRTGLHCGRTEVSMGAAFNAWLQGARQEGMSRVAAS